MSLPSDKEIDVMYGLKTVLTQIEAAVAKRIKVTTNIQLTGANISIK